MQPAALLTLRLESSPPTPVLLPTSSTCDGEPLLKHVRTGPFRGNLGCQICCHGLQLRSHIPGAVLLVDHTPQVSYKGSKISCLLRSLDPHMCQLGMFSC
jgi:hypothetical protein